MKKKLKISVPDLIMHIILLFVVVLTLYPFIHMVAVSLSDNIYVMQGNVSFYPKGFNTLWYEAIFSDHRVGSAYMYTIIYTLTGTLVAMVCTFTCAYPLSKKRRLFGFKFFNLFLVIPMFFGGGMVPLYIIILKLNMIDTLWAVILPGAVSSWNVFIMRAIFQSFPQEVEESAMIDGMNDILILWHIVLPLSKAVLATIGLFYAVGLWNAFFGPYIFLNTEKKFPLQVFLRSLIFVEQETKITVGGREAPLIPEAYKYTAIIVAIIPIVMVYPFLQRYFVKGVMIGSLKG